MSAAAAATDATDAPKKKGSKKLIIIIAVAVLVLGGAAAAFFIMQKNAAAAAAAAAAEEEGEDGTAPKVAAQAKDPKAVPNFLPLDPFVVNLADRDQDRFAQIGVTLQVDDAKVADQLKTYMPAIRNGVLMILAHKTSTELLERAGKEKLAAEIMREAVRPLGIEIEDEDEDEAEKVEEEKPGKTKKKKRKPAPPHNPVERVHFSSFIIQ